MQLRGIFFFWVCALGQENLVLTVCNKYAFKGENGTNVSHQDARVWIYTEDLGFRKIHDSDKQLLVPVSSDGLGFQMT